MAQERIAAQPASYGGWASGTCCTSARASPPRPANATGWPSSGAVTRQPGSEAARALSERGAEIVTADLDNSASVQRAMQGAHGAFCVTNLRAHFSAERELAQADALARAAQRQAFAP